MKHPKRCEECPGLWQQIRYRQRHRWLWTVAAAELAAPRSPGLAHPALVSLLPGVTWERADKCPAAKPARPVAKKRRWPSVTARSAHVAGRGHSPTLCCESSACAEREECLRTAESPLGQTRPVHLVWLPPTPASSRCFKGLIPHCRASQ